MSGWPRPVPKIISEEIILGYRTIIPLHNSIHMLRFHENSSNHPKDFTSLFLGENSFLVFHLAFISYEKLFEYTAMHLATWKPDFTGGCKQRVNCYQIARHVSPDTIQTSPNIRFLGGLIFEKYLSITFLDVVVQNRYIYTLLVNIF